MANSWQTGKLVSVFSVNFTLPQDTTLYIPDTIRVGTGVVLKVEAGATLRVGAWSQVQE